MEQCSQEIFRSVEAVYEAAVLRHVITAGLVAERRLDRQRRHSVSGHRRVDRSARSTSQRQGSAPRPGITTGGQLLQTQGFDPWIRAPLKMVS